MFHRFRERLTNRRYGFRSITAVAFFCLLTGLVVASGSNWTHTSAAQNSQHITPVSTAPVVRDSLAPLAEELAPTVVNVKVTKIEKAGLNQIPFRGAPFDDFFKHFFGENFQMPNQRPAQGAGSGVVISDDGFILTNNHVVEGAQEVTVTLADKRDFKAEIVGRDPKTDLAILKISAGKNLPAAKMGDSDRLKVGDYVIAIGNPFGLSHTVTSGIVSAKGRIIGAGPYDDFIQTDASINPGNSGGPLFNMNGEVVGINTAIVPNGQGIGFAIPVNTAKPLIPQLVKNGKVTRGYIGVNIQSISPDIAKAMKLDNDKGALVADVIPDGPAADAGIKRGDVIISFNGKTVKDSHDLPTMVAATPIGDNANITILRDGKEKEIRVRIAELPSDGSGVESSAKPAQGKWGLQLQDLTPDIARQLGLDTDHGVLIAGVQPGSPADDASIQQGDVILEVNRHPVKSVEEVKKAVDKAKDKNSLLLLVQRDQARMFVALSG